MAAPSSKTSPTPHSGWRITALSRASGADALFRDPLAGVLAGDHGRLIAGTMPQPAMTTWAVVIRTCIIDDFIREAIAQGADTILNLGAGLDTRPYRMELPASLAWIEATTRA